MIVFIDWTLHKDTSFRLLSGTDLVYQKCVEKFPPVCPKSLLVWWIYKQKRGDVMEIQQIRFALSLVDNYIKANCEYEGVRDVPLKTAKALYDMLPAEEREIVPAWIINESRLDLFLEGYMKST